MSFKCPSVIATTIKSFKRVEKTIIRVYSARSISTTSPWHTNTGYLTKAAKSNQAKPLVSKVQHPSKNHKRPPEPKDFSINEQLPSTALLKSAKKSKALDIEPEVALNVLRKYIELSREKQRGWEMQVCQGTHSDFYLKNKKSMMSNIP